MKNQNTLKILRFSLYSLLKNPFILSLLYSINTFAQYPLAPEVWSIPEEIDIISEYASRAESPSISFDNNKLYFHGISMTERADTGWL